jgi:hypothetical protein
MAVVVENNAGLGLEVTFSFSRRAQLKAGGSYLILQCSTTDVRVARVATGSL